MRLNKIISLILAVVLLLAALGGCDSAADFLLYFELDKRPQTLDPQLAQGVNDETVVTALFEGLVRFNSAGEPVAAAAEKVEVSKDALTYTFTLRNGAVWSDEQPVTADDFVFAFERALSAKTAAPQAARLLCIQNAVSFQNGAKAPLGVRAADARTLVIQLAYKNDDFLKTLTLPVCMPCRRDYFEKCGGKYGLDREHLITNGPFTLYSWATDTGEDFSMRLNRAKLYHGSFAGAASAVIFSESDHAAGRAQRIALGNLDFAYILPEEKSDDIAWVCLENTCCALVVNRESEVGSVQMRGALSGAIHHNSLKNDVGEQMTVTQQLLPASLKIGQTGVEQLHAPAAAYDPEDALKLYKKAVSENGAVTAASILYYGESDGRLARLVAESFQKNLSFFVNVEECSSLQVLLQRVREKDYKLAVLPVTAQGNDALDYLGQWNSYRLTKADFSSSLQAAAKQSAAEKVKVAEQVLQTIAQEKTVLPLAHRAEILAYNKQYVCPDFTGYITVLDLAMVRLKK